MRRMRVLPVMNEADFRATVAQEGAYVEIECVREPASDSRASSWEWMVSVVTPGGEKFVLVTARSRFKVYSSPEGLLSFARNKLGLASVSIPLHEGLVTTGMRMRDDTGPVKK